MGTFLPPCSISGPVTGRTVQASEACSNLRGVATERANQAFALGPEPTETLPANGWLTATQNRLNLFNGCIQDTASRIPLTMSPCYFWYIFIHSISKKNKTFVCIIIAVHGGGAGPFHMGESLETPVAGGAASGRTRRRKGNADAKHTGFLHHFNKNKN